MSAIITTTSRVLNAKRYLTDNFDDSVDQKDSYFYIGRPTAWDEEDSPDISVSSNIQINDALLQRIFMKKIEYVDTSLALKKYIWDSRIFFRADHDIDFTDIRTWGHVECPFYIINSEENVYKCISNNNDSLSTIEPTGQLLGYTTPGDGYIWKFMFDLTTTISDKFLTDTWIPVPDETTNKSSTHLSVESNAVDGDIPYIHLTNAGIGYTSTPSIEIRGDGTGATAIAIMLGESIDYIQVSDAGSGYSYAEVKIFGNGVDGAGTAMISPKGGHGSNASYELGAFFTEVSVEIIGDEDGECPTTGTYRNVGVVNGTENTSAAIITDEKYNTLSSINITDASGNFTTDEMIIGEDSYAQGFLYHDPTGTNKVINMYMIDGVFTDGEIIHGQTSSESGTFNTAGSTFTTVNILSGEILYKENIIFITRREIQIEKFVFTIEF